MKRLQFRHNNEVFKSRELVVKYFADMVDSTNTASTVFKSSLYAEPLVAKYLDEDGNTQVIFAIGVDSGLTPYHIIDSKEISELILANKTAIELETERAKASETSLNEAIIAEVNRASAAELSLSGSIDTEREERIYAVKEEREERVAADELESNERRDSDEYLQAQITKNISTIVPVTENLSANVREEYVLKNADGEEMGSHIKIYKDSALVGAEVNFKGATAVSIKDDGTFEFTYGADMDKEVEYLYLIYRNESGGLNLVGLDFENFLMENEEGLGIKIVDHKITVKIKGGERYLTVTEDGVQTINISEDIEAASKKLNDELIAKLDAEIDRSSKVDEETNATINAFSASTISELNKLSEEVHATIDSVSAETVNTIKEVSAITTTNIERLDSLIVAESNRAQESESGLKSLIETEVERAEGVEAELTSAINDEATLRENRDNELSAEILSDRVNSKDIVVNKTAEGTTLTIQTDEVTLTKYADAQAIYDTEVSILGSLLKIKKVETTDSSVKSRYELQGANNKCIGDPIILPVESALVDVKQGKEGDTIDEVTGNYITFGSGDTTMNFVYRLEDGTYELMQVVVSDYFTDSHFGRGLNNQDGVVSLLEGDGNEFLVIGDDTIAVTGVSSAIHTAFDEAKAYTDTKINDLSVIVDNKNSESISHTDSEISKLTATVNSNFETATALAESRYSESKSYTDEQIAAVNSNASNLSDKLDEKVGEINNALSTEKSEREAADTVLRGLIDANTSSINSLILEDNTINGKINNLSELITTVSGNVEHKIIDVTNDITTKYKAEDLSLSNRINGVSADLTTLSGNVENTFVNTINTLTSGYKADDAVILGQAKEYSDNSLAKAKEHTNESIKTAVDTINGKKVSDVAYDNGNKKIYLTFADGTMSTGFDASEFVVDGMLDNVSFDNNTNEIKFVWNTSAEKTEIIVPLDKFVDQYTVSEDSISYLSISDDNKIHVIVDKSDNYGKTLATTEYVEAVGQTVYNAARSGAVNDAKDYTNTKVSEVTSKVGTLETSVNNDFETVRKTISSLETKHNSDIETVSNTLNTKIDSNSQLLTERITSNKTAIDVLNSGKDVPGSIVNKVDTELNKRIIINGVPITEISIEQAKETSLIREIKFDNGESRYYVSNEINSMVYVKPNGERIPLSEYILGLEHNNETLEAKLAEQKTELEGQINALDTKLGTQKTELEGQISTLETKLAEQKTELEGQISTLETRLETLESAIDAKVKEIINSYVIGTEKEVKVEVGADHLKIGFDDNAIFGEE